MTTNGVNLLTNNKLTRLVNAGLNNVNIRCVFVDELCVASDLFPTLNLLMLRLVLALTSLSARRSLDTLDPRKFTVITRRLGQERVLAAIYEAVAANLRTKVPKPHNSSFYFPHFGLP